MAASRAGGYEQPRDVFENLRVFTSFGLSIYVLGFWFQNLVFSILF